jgi:hypothetical protein
MKIQYALLLATSPLVAKDLSSQVSALEAKMNEVSTRTSHNNIGAKTASASPQIIGENWVFSGDLLWWHVSEGGTDYAQLFKGDSLVENRELTFKWNYGFRAAIGKTFLHDKWDLSLNFTWFRADNSSASSLHGGEFLSPLFLTPPLQASQVKIHWSLQFYDFDLNLGRHYFVSSKLAFHPFLGLKTAFIDQHIHSSASVFAPEPAHFHAKDKNDFWGIGPSIGTSGKWFLDYGFHLFGSIAGAVLWGDFDVHHREVNETLDLLRASFNLDTHQISPMTQMQLGIGYETNLYHNRYHIAVCCSYESQYWWDQNQLPAFDNFTQKRLHRYSEDLNFQGLTVDVRFDF